MRRMTQLLRRLVARLLSRRVKPCGVCGGPALARAIDYPVCPRCRPGWEADRLAW